MKKVTSLLLTLIMALSMIGIASGTAEGSKLEPITLKIMVPENDPAGMPFQLADLVSGKISHPVWDIFQSWMAEKNLTLEFELIADAQYDVVAQTRLASGLELPDIMNVRRSAITSSQLMSYANMGILLPVSDIIDEYCLPETKEIIDAKYADYYGITANPENGKSYVYGQINANTVDGVSNTYTVPFHLRYDWMQDLGIDMPESIWDLIDIGEEMQAQDANGNGIIGDEVFYINPNESFYGLGDSFGLVPMLLTGMVDDGTNTIVSPWYQEGVKDYFRFMQELYANGLLDLSIGYTQLNAENRLIGAYKFAYQDMFEQASTDEDCFYIPLGMLPGADGVAPVAWVNPSFNYNDQYQFAVTNACENVEGVARLIDILFSADYEYLTIAGIEGVNYTLVEGNGDVPVLSTNINFLISDSSVAAMREAGMSTGYRLWGKGIFPRIGTTNVYSSFIQQKIDNYTNNGDWQNAMRIQSQLDSYSYYPKAIVKATGYLAMPTDAEAERKNELTTDLQTYASELFINLVTGTTSLDDWDSYIEDLKALGLDELIEIDQTLADRMKGN